MSLLDSFVTRAALGGVGVALAAGPLGCFVVWRRMAYFGDATAHAALLGVTLAVAVDVPIFAGALLIALGMSALVTNIASKGRQSTDTLLGVLAHSALAAGLVAVSLLPNVTIDLSALLLGDVLSIGRADLATIWLGALLVNGLLAWRWSSLLTATLHPDLARASGIDPERERRILSFVLAVVVAVAIKVVGVLLIAALLIIPAAAARPLSATPERMALLAAGIGVASALGGLTASWFADTPAGPGIVCCAAAAFFATNLRRT